VQATAVLLIVSPDRLKLASGEKVPMGEKFENRLLGPTILLVFFSAVSIFSALLAEPQKMRQ
jgi:hypothetical protein